MFGTPVSDLQEDIVISNNNITGTLKYLDSGSLVTTWGAGNFIALKFTDIPAYATSIKVGLHPSQGSGLVELDSDYNGVFKITDKDTQVFRVETTISGIVNDVDYDLSGLVCLD